MKWLAQKFIANVLRPKWVVYRTVDGHEFGLEIFGQVITCYKSEIMFADEYWEKRSPEKRELGESLHVPTR
jgi:hypothetical protein